MLKIARIISSFAACALLAEDVHAQVNSSLVYPGPDGKLVYAGYANNSRTAADNLMIDFSYAGYQGGGVPIPWVPEVLTLEPIAGGGDDHARIQAAIDTVSAMPLSPAGFRGAILLKAGQYRVSQTLLITADGVVIRGEGQDTAGTTITLTATVQDNLFEFSGADLAWRKVSGEPTRRVTDAVVPCGTRSFHLDSVAGLTVGDRFMVARTPNWDWIDMLGMRIYDWEPPGYRCEMPRRITAIEGNRVTVDAPIANSFEEAYGGAEAYRYHFNGALRNVGIENLRCESTYLSATDENHGWTAIWMKGVENGWARRITARFFGFGCVSVTNRCQFITVEDCAMTDYKSEVTGGRRYGFNMDDAYGILFQRCYARSGRHDFVTGSNPGGPTVFVDGLSEIATSDIGPHHRYAQGILFDNIKGYEINVQNREGSGSGHGWAGAQTVFWNCTATNLLKCQTPKAAMNFAIGCSGTRITSAKYPEGFWEHRNTTVTPRSLYYKQLEDRLGTRAIMNVIASAQLTGNMWSRLSSWKGTTAVSWLPSFGPLRVDAGPVLYTEANTPLAIGAVLRCPLPSNFQTSHAWTKLSGPGNVTFGNAQELHTTAQFSANGTYTLQCEVTQQNGAEQYTGTSILSVSVGYTPPPSDPSLKIWTGAGGASWDTDANWNALGAPSASQTAVFTSTSSSGFSNHIGSTRSIKSITFDASTATTPYTIHLANGLTLPIDTTTTRTLTLTAGGGIAVQAGNHTIKGLAPGSGTTGELKLVSGTNFNVAANSSLTIEARLAQTASTDTYTKSGAGTLVLKANSGGGSSWGFSNGGFTISQGTMQLAASGAAGFSGNKYNVSSGATLEIAASGAYGSVNGTLSLNGTGVDGNGALFASATTTIGAGTGSIVLASNARIGVDDDQTFTLGMPITGASRALDKAGAGILSLTGINTYTGPTTVSDGTLLINGANTLTTGTVSVADGARLGGNGSTPAAVTVQANGGLAMSISSWTGSAGSGFTDLDVGALGFTSTWTLEVSSAFADFTEANAVFPFLTASGGIFGFNPANVVVEVPPSFTGTGTWSVVQSGNSLQLVYTRGTDPIQDYADWDNAHPGADLSDKNADHDGDGMSNFQEYAFGLDPTNGASVQPLTDFSETKEAGIFHYTRRANSGLRYTVWTSPDLETWTEQVEANQASISSVSGVETVRVTLEEIPTADSLFIRVQAQ